MVERTQHAGSREGLRSVALLPVPDSRFARHGVEKRSIFRKPTEHVRHLNDIELDYNALNGRSFPDCTVQVVKAGLFKSRFRKKETELINYLNVK